MTKRVIVYIIVKVFVLYIRRLVWLEVLKISSAFKKTNDFLYMSILKFEPGSMHFYWEIKVLTNIERVLRDLKSQLIQGF